MKEWIVHIEFKDIVEALVFLLAVVTFWKTTRTDKKNDAIAAEVKRQEAERARQQAEHAFERQRQEVRLGLVELSLAYERRRRELSFLLPKAHTTAVIQPLSDELSGVTELLSKIRDEERKIATLPIDASSDVLLALQQIQGSIKAQALALPLDDQNHARIIKAAEDAIAHGG